MHHLLQGRNVEIMSFEQVHIPYLWYLAAKVFICDAAAHLHMMSLAVVRLRDIANRVTHLAIIKQVLRRVESYDKHVTCENSLF